MNNVIPFNSINLENRKLIKDFKIVLKDLEPLVKDPRFLWNGRDLSNFSLRPREIWANWLICVVLRKLHGDNITFMDDCKGDGFLVDREMGVMIPTEHVCALDISVADDLPKGEDRIINAIKFKISKSKYDGKILVVFFDGAGKFYRSKIRKAVYGKHHFEAIFCVGLLESSNDKYSYSVTEFRESFKDKSITHRVDINGNFDDWKITQILK
ncbi:hypothetical protein COT97_02495 [Candidatus Falkowbacteria bacterium CG10_big_fil_rev_8_21_14_0_10_39_11]|uniref:Uncharacterized protein n=1 Tax=Candidatus Falkowbacteria bacterium CG10_big_fil_rev_8_21_14_0_10_39_11 TaxID=1974565 RepID=A0A2H0V727_9BACT|nr:MAG: hypothetical protein COT97_02495 [Candidatus Falkowbacteria bacterium CG10_big_fil_rev_8_21_14_0_10_39_11]